MFFLVCVDGLKSDEIMTILIVSMMIIEEVDRVVVVLVVVVVKAVMIVVEVAARCGGAARVKNLRIKCKRRIEKFCSSINWRKSSRM